VRNWFDGRNGPSGENLVRLIQHSDAVLSAVLRASRRDQLLPAVALMRLKASLQMAIDSLDEAFPSRWPNHASWTRAKVASYEALARGTDMKFIIAFVIIAASAVPIAVAAHSGGLNAEGCHNDRKRGGYHCHRAGGGSSSPSRPRGWGRLPRLAARLRTALRPVRQVRLPCVGAIPVMDGT